MPDGRCIRFIAVRLQRTAECRAEIGRKGGPRGCVVYAAGGAGDRPCKQAQSLPAPGWGAGYRGSERETWLPAGSARLRDRSTDSARPRGEQDEVDDKQPEKGGR